MPMLQTLGINPVYFGVVMVLNVTIGAITPPVGTYLFIMSNLGKVPLDKVIRYTLPWLIPLLIVLFTVTIFPEIILFIPRMVGLVQ